MQLSPTRKVNDPYQMRAPAPARGRQSLKAANHQVSTLQKNKNVARLPSGRSDTNAVFTWHRLKQLLREQKRLIIGSGDSISKVSSAITDLDLGLQSN